MSKKSFIFASAVVVIAVIVGSIIANKRENISSPGISDRVAEPDSETSAQTTNGVPDPIKSQVSELRSSIDELETRYRELQAQYRQRYEKLMKGSEGAEPKQAISKARSEYRDAVSEHPQIKAVEKEIRSLSNKNAALHEELNAALAEVQDQMKARREYWQGRREELLKERQQETQGLIGKDPNDLSQAEEDRLKSILKEYETRLREVSEEHAAEREDPPDELEQAREQYREVADRISTVKAKLEKARQRKKKLRQELPKTDQDLRAEYNAYTAARAEAQEAVKDDPKLKTLKRQMREVESQIAGKKAEISRLEAGGLRDEAKTGRTDSEHDLLDNNFEDVKRAYERKDA
jgi:DNA repair exonuclease SbcCD ATPase subunit